MVLSGAKFFSLLYTFVGTIIILLMLFKIITVAKHFVLLAFIFICYAQNNVASSATYALYSTVCDAFSITIVAHFKE